VVENVASGARAWVDAVRAGLGEHGYETLPIPLSAADVGARHKRARIFIVAANVDAVWEPACALDAEVGREQKPASDVDSDLVRDEPRGLSRTYGAGARVAKHNSWGPAEPNMVRVVHGVRGRLDSPTRRIKALGNAVVPQCAEVVGHVIQELARLEKPR
jgi:site-specific DNA-cytosine methylase